MKPNGKPAPIDLAARVADGSRVDWPNLEANATSLDDRALLDGLQLIERIAEVHSAPHGHSTGPDDRPGHVMPVDLPRQWGPLVIVDRLGGGTFGTVYRARDPKLDRHVALKLLTRRDRTDESTETLSDQAVIDEGRLMARIRHPGVITVYGADQFDGHVGVWMELLGGRTLEAEVRERGSLPPAEIVRIASAVADALAAVHRAGLIHRDVKAQNVIREPDGRIVLMDFGTGIDRGDAASAAGLAGTPLYLAPEVIEGAAATAASDVYSLGVLLHHLATADFPVRGRTLQEVRRAHARSDRRTTVDARPDLPQSIARVIDRALSVKPADRYRDAGEMAGALNEIQTRARRRRVAVAVAAGAVVLAIAAAVGWMAGSRRPAGPVAPNSVVMEPIDPALQRAPILGPSFGGGVMPCIGARGALALCDLRTRGIDILRPSADGAGMVPLPSPRALISPDASRLAYLWTHPKRDQQAQYDLLHIFDLGSRSSRPLFQSAVMELTRWTPDGTAVVVRDGRGDDGGSYLRVPLDGRAPETLLQLTPRDDRRADLSPDGRTMVVARESEPGHRDLVGIDVATGEERWRRKGTTDDAEPRWTPDGSSIVFVTNMTGCHSLGQVRMESGRPTASATVLSEMGPTTQLLGFGPDGVLLIRQRLYSYQTITSSIDLEARSFSEARLLRTSQCDMLVGADWNRDGSRIAHVAGRPAAGVRSQLVIERPEGQDRSEIDLAYDFVEFAQTRWAPDSGRVAVLYRTGLPLGSKAFDVLEIADVRRDSLARTTIERWPVEGQAKSVAWDPRGDALYFRQGSEIVRASLQSNTPTFTPVYHAPSEVGLTRGLDVSREGVLAIGHSRDVDTRECIVRVVRPGSPPHYQRTLEGWCQSLTWTRDGRRILVGTAPDVGVSSLFLIEPATGSVDRIEGTAPEPNFWHLSLGPDDRQVLFTAGRTTQPWKMIQIRGIR